MTALENDALKHQVAALSESSLQLIQLFAIRERTLFNQIRGLELSKAVWISKLKRERDDARAEVDCLRAHIQELLHRAWKFDDKPHQLFSFIQVLAEKYASEREAQEICRLMGKAYMNAPLIASELARKRALDLLAVPEEHGLASLGVLEAIREAMAVLRGDT